MPKKRSSRSRFPFVAVIGIVLLAGAFVVSLLSVQAVREAESTRVSAQAKSTSTFTATQVFTEDGNTFNSGTWIGNGQSTKKSFTGIRFENISLPDGASVESVELRLTSDKEQWISLSTKIGIENSSAPAAFSASALPSTRSIGAATVTYANNEKWEKGRQYTIAKLPSSALSPSATSVSFIIQGTGGQWGRKSILGASGVGAPSLVITYALAGSSPTATPTVQPTTRPTSSPSPTAAPTSSPTAAPTSTPHTTGHGENSHAMGLWTPTRFDTCPKELHDRYKVKGPDGKWYPTWHPPVVTNPATGKQCSFGHEHGRNPAEYAFYDEVRRHFAYDEDANGTISATELATAGIPFGYVNEQLDMTPAAAGTGGFMRHEDHVGHKIEFANGEGDIGDGTDPFDSNKTGGVVVPVKTGGATKWTASGIRCYHFHKIHQGVHSPDALTNNLHEAILHAKCTSTRADVPSFSSLLAGFIPFGAPGEFTKICGADRTTIIKLGVSAANAKFPGQSGKGQRNITTRDCVESTVLVPSGQFSAFPYEIWEGSLTIKTAAGRVIATQDGSWEVLDAIRYYNPASPNKISYTSTWCTEVIGDRRARGGACDQMTDYGRIRDITWDDPRSLFRGLHRGQYILPPAISNAGGSTYWYTDAFGGNAQTKPFPGSVRQMIAPVNASVIGKFPSDPRIILRNYTDGGGTVHAPN